eukprot:CAMPEP_0183339656 /NCGR_PEP_ID=MMETSP0164_2-20130417/6502_1 /TAXON_ID=221442 /ORGANISM="Coccolithus pelagicus ssp braarudi, Strain PLY182g" /LENGTH=170 /DNA_ID=CAMNT_0025509685 /DNA_START=234 /DNA_END=746 /DNA_ORIENTATION=-
MAPVPSEERPKHLWAMLPVSALGGCGDGVGLAEQPPRLGDRPPKRERRWPRHPVEERQCVDDCATVRRRIKAAPQGRMELQAAQRRPSCEERARFDRTDPDHEPPQLLLAVARGGSLGRQQRARLVTHERVVVGKDGEAWVDHREREDEPTGPAPEPCSSLLVRPPQRQR